MIHKTVREIAAAWKEYKRPYVKQSTMAAYVLILENHVLPYFGDGDSLHEQEVQAFVLQKLGRGLSVKTVKDILIVLKMVMKFGVKNEWMTYYEWDIKYPTTSTNKELEVLSVANHRKILNYIQSHFTFTGLGIYISLSTGLRIGEICALKWSDVDFANERIWIHRFLRMIKNRSADGGNKTILIEKETKTKNGRRFITITSRVREALEFFLQFKASEDGYVCVNKNMNPMRRERLWRSLNRMLKNAGMNHYTIHELRHSFGSLLLEKSDNQDRAIAAISRILGHANVNITYNIYIHILDARLTTTFQILDDYTVENAFSGTDIEMDPNDTDTDYINDNDGNDYKEKYEELKKMLINLSLSA